MLLSPEPSSSNTSLMLCCWPTLLAYLPACVLTIWLSDWLAGCLTDELIEWMHACLQISLCTAACPLVNKRSGSIVHFIFMTGTLLPSPSPLLLVLMPLRLMVMRPQVTSTIRLALASPASDKRCRFRFWLTLKFFLVLLICAIFYLLVAYGYSSATAVYWRPLYYPFHGCLFFGAHCVDAVVVTTYEPASFAASAIARFPLLCTSAAERNNRVVGWR